jgi:hypothetical protein
VDAVDGTVDTKDESEVREAVERTDILSVSCWGGGERSEVEATSVVSPAPSSAKAPSLITVCGICGGGGDFPVPLPLPLPNHPPIQSPILDVLCTLARRPCPEPLLREGGIDLVRTAEAFEGLMVSSLDVSGTSTWVSDERMERAWMEGDREGGSVRCVRVGECERGGCVWGE